MLSCVLEVQTSNFDHSQLNAAKTSSFIKTAEYDVLYISKYRKLFQTEIYAHLCFQSAKLQHSKLPLQISRNNVINLIIPGKGVLCS